MRIEPMPPRTSASKPPAPPRKFPWLGVTAVLLLVCAGVYYFLGRSASAPTAPAPTAAPAPTTSTPAPGAVPFTAKHIYSETANPEQDIAAGMAEARRNHKRVLLDFGGDWCGDCQVLDIYFHQAPNDQLLNKNFVLVHVWIGHMDTNLDVAQKYGVPINRGVPALAVLTPQGKVLYSQATGQFADMRHMEPGSVTEFLDKWKG
jgi:thiol:disulfide interchange protein